MDLPEVTYQVTIDVLTLVVALTTAFWVVFRYNRSRKLEAAQWLHDLYSEFYLSGRFDKVKNQIEYNYEEYFARLVEMRINDRQVPITNDEVKLMDELDTFLNYLEHLLGLESIGLISKEEREIIFDYWPRMFNYDWHASLRLYIAICGYEQLDKELNLTMDEYVAIYGSLRREINDPRSPDKSGLLEYVGQCKIAGQLIDYGDYPGLQLYRSNSRVLHAGRRFPDTVDEGTPAVNADLYKIVSPKAYDIFDDWEDYDPANISRSRYARKFVRLIDPKVDAWVYASVNREEDGPIVEHGDWVRHCRETGLVYSEDGPLHKTQISIS